MKKVRSLSKERIDEISALIGASFWDYPYEPGEGGLNPFFPSKAAMTEYMKSFVIAGIESGTIYSTDHGEGYILITDTNGNHTNFRSIVKMARRMKNALGGWGKRILSIIPKLRENCPMTSLILYSRLCRAVSRKLFSTN